jgi:ribosomal protein S21
MLIINVKNGKIDAALKQYKKKEKQVGQRKKI